MFYSTTYPSPLGIITLACNGHTNQLVGLWIEGQKYHGDTVTELLHPNHKINVFNNTKQWLDRYFAGQKPDVTELPLAPIGGEFRQEIWRILCKIPYGKVITYGDIAKQMAIKMGRSTMSSQAVGGAVGHNPISIIIPCHRVVGANGSLTGYAGGINMKVKLLELECVDMSELYIPKKSSAI